MSTSNELDDSMEEKITCGIDVFPPSFHVKARILGEDGEYAKFITKETGAIIHVRGRGSNYGNDNRMPTPLYVHLIHKRPNIEMKRKARRLVTNLIRTVQSDYIKECGIHGSLPDDPEIIPINDKSELNYPDNPLTKKSDITSTSDVDKSKTNNEEKSFDKITIGIKNIPQNFDLKKRLHGQNDEHIMHIKRKTGAIVTIKELAKAEPYVVVEYSERRTKSEARKLIVDLIKSLHADFIDKYGLRFTTIENPKVFPVLADDSSDPPQITKFSPSAESASLLSIAPWTTPAPVPPPPIISNKNNNVAISSTTKNNFDEMNLNPNTSDDAACVTLSDDEIDHDSLVGIEPSNTVEPKISESSLMSAVESFKGLDSKIPMFTGHNYQEWKIKVELMFQIWMKSDLLIEKNELMMSPEELKQWRASNKQAVAVILLHVDIKHVPTFKNISYVKELLDTMDQFFGDSDKSVQSNLSPVKNNTKEKCTNCSKHNHDTSECWYPKRTVNKSNRNDGSQGKEHRESKRCTHCYRTNHVVSECRYLGVKKSQRAEIMLAQNGGNSDQKRSTHGTSNSLFLLHEEDSHRDKLFDDRRAALNDTRDISSWAEEVERDKKQNMKKINKTCFKCRGIGHIAIECRHPSNKNAAHLSQDNFESNQNETRNKKCLNCGKNGHLASECYAPSSKGNRNNNATDNNHWQRDNLTEHSGKVQFKQKLCYNCNKLGHIGAECNLPDRRKATRNNADSDEEIGIGFEEETNAYFSDRTAPKFMRGNRGGRIARGGQGSGRHKIFSASNNHRAPSEADELGGTGARTYAPGKASGFKRGKYF